MNGKIDIAFLPDLNAKVALRSDYGEIFSDFRIEVSSNPNKQIVEDSRVGGGRYRVRLNKTIFGSIGVGGLKSKSQTSMGTYTYVKLDGYSEAGVLQDPRVPKKISKRFDKWNFSMPRNVLSLDAEVNGAANHFAAHCV